MAPWRRGTCRSISFGTPIAKRFEAVFASKYLFDANGLAQWPALAINYTTKPQYLFRINKGVKGRISQWGTRWSLDVDRLWAAKRAYQRQFFENVAAGRVKGGSWFSEGPSVTSCLIQPCEIGRLVLSDP